MRAVLFDFGGTLYDYRSLAAGDRECLLALAAWAGVTDTPEAIQLAYRDAMRRVFRTYLPRRYYLHRDLFRDAAAGMIESFGRPALDEHLERYRAVQWESHARDFVLREGVVETLETLRARGLHVGLVSNIDEDQLAHLMALARLEPYFDSMLSSERAGSCKPDRAIFAEAVRRAGCEPGEALFVGDTLAQDVAGANNAGLRSALLWHRDDREPPSDPAPHHVIRRIPEVLGIIGG